MNIRVLFSAILLTASVGCSEEEKPSPSPEKASTKVSERSVQALSQSPMPTPAPNSASISVQEMLQTGPTQLKMHSLAMILQNNLTVDIDESFLPGFTVCASDSNPPIRMITAELLGKHYIQNQETPNPKAIELLKKLADDKSADVRYNAVYHGLSQLKVKSDQIISLLIDLASKDKEQKLSTKIAEALKSDLDRVIKILDEKLKEGNNVAAFEVYKELTGKEPPYTDKYLDAPSSLPRLFIFSAEGSNIDAQQANLEKALKEAGIGQPAISRSGSGENQVFLLKTYLTKDRLTVEKEFANHPEFAFVQSMWLTPHLENQIKMQQPEQN